MEPLPRGGGFMLKGRIMNTLTRQEMSRRRIILKDRLEESYFMRSHDFKPETAEVWMAIADGFYGGYTVNVSGIARKTKIDKATVSRHVERLLQRDIPMVTRQERGQDTILRLAQFDLLNPTTTEFFSCAIKPLSTMPRLCAL